MDTELLKTFLAVQQSGHFGRAAEDLFVTQAAVSARIKLLESLLGSPVFSRYRNNLQLTDTGERLVPHAQSVLAAWDGTLRDLASPDSAPIALRIGAPPTLWDVFLQQSVLPTLIGDDGPPVQAEVISSEQLQRRLLERTVDLTFQFVPAKNSAIKSIVLPSIKLMLVASEPRDINSETALSDYIKIDWGSSPDHPINPVSWRSARLQTGLVPLALDLMLRQGGCAYLPEPRVAGYLGRLLHRVAGAEARAQPIVACYHQNSNIQPQILRVIEQARDELQSSNRPATPESP
ncbi:LysR family transcriptional regulator [Reinekea sp.]|jgi:DNA-binding transcriptional LysR family regulator|uniref:LysR family transcriptional regulator n=1 Tax=Reinekea sp. TaxID=1970455 RepID=UPI002A841B99|nr:LysR family transcriptional regulator [Reinekea sp.]